MTSPLSYIWGAPGTGKTKHVLASCVYSYIKSGKKVLLLAPTNTALEQSLRGLLRALEDRSGFTPDGKALRLGIPSDGFRTAWQNICGRGAYEYMRQQIQERIDRLKAENGRIEESLEFYAGKAAKDAVDRYARVDGKTLTKRKAENIAEINELLKLSRKMTETKSIMPAIGRYSVIAATVDACIHWLTPDGAFQPDHVFLDEAGYCSVIKGMTLTGYGRPITMLGDHMQLPPVFDCDDKILMNAPTTRIVKLWQISTLYNEDVIYSDDRYALCAHDLYRKPMFEHMAVGTLNDTHRFGPVLAKILDERIYRNRFRSQSRNETQILFVNAPKSEADKAMDEDGNHQRISHAEARCIRDMMEQNLFRIEYTTGIITPYRNQRQMIEGYIHRLMKKHDVTADMDEDILTVHRSQGREWDVVLFSVTDTYDERWMTNSERIEALKMINTAVSRAKKLLVLVGDAESW